MIDNARSATTDGLTISPSLDLVTEAAHVPAETSIVDRRVVKLCGVAILLGATASVKSCEGALVSCRRHIEVSC